MQNKEVQREEVVPNSDTLPVCWTIGPFREETPAGLSKASFGDGVWQTEKSGKLKERIVRDIQASREMVCIASFLLSDPEIIKATIDAAGRGVRAYLITASENLLKQEGRENSEYEEKRVKEHIDILNSLAGFVLVRTSDHLHSKFILVDPKGKSPKGYLLTANLTPEALTRNPELGIELTETQARDLFRQFVHGFWEEASRELLEPGQLRPVKKFKPKQTKLPEKILYTIGEESTILSTMLDMIARAKSEIWLSTFGIEDGHEVTRELLNARKDGKTVRLLTRPRPNASHMKALVALANAGAEVRGHRWLHGKALVIDTAKGHEGLVMTANVSRRGLNSGFETGVLVSGAQSEALRSALSGWWDDFHQNLRLNVKITDLDGEILVWDKNDLKKVKILDNLERDLGIVKVKKENDLDSAKPRAFPKPKDEDAAVKYKKTTYKWINSLEMPEKTKSEADKDDERDVKKQTDRKR